MALRVLLADESSTIKKVMQLALQDFAVEVKAVPVGLDVLPVTKAYKPDIVFADILLTKRNGYEVCADLKADPETQHLPVVLMWSGFMEADEQKVSASKANGRLEKPFDADALRKLVMELVPKTHSNPVSSYLQFPEMPTFEEEAPAAMAPLQNNPFEDATVVGKSIAPKIPQEIPVEIPKDGDLKFSEDGLLQLTPEESGIHNISKEEASPFSMQTLSPEASAFTADEDNEDGWTRQDLTKFKIHLPEEDDFAQKFVIPQDDLSNINIKMDTPGSEFEEILFDAKTTVRPSSQASIPAPSKQPENPSVKASSPLDLSPEMMEKIVREEVRAVVESICWKILPDIAERLVKEEIKKLLNDAEKSI